MKGQKRQEARRAKNKKRCPKEEKLVGYVRARRNRGTGLPAKSP